MTRITKIIDGYVQVDPFISALKDKITKGLLTGAVAVDLYRPNEDKTDDQREKFHAMIGDIKKSCIISLPGKRVKMSDYSFLACKAMLVMWFYNEKVLSGEGIPNPPEYFTDPLTLQLITERPSTKVWGKKLTSEFVEFLYATGANGGTIWSEPALKEYESYKQAKV